VLGDGGMAVGTEVGCPRAPRTPFPCPGSGQDKGRLLVPHLFLHGHAGQVSVRNGDAGNRRRYTGSPVGSPTSRAHGDRFWNGGQVSTTVPHDAAVGPEELVVLARHREAGSPCRPWR